MNRRRTDELASFLQRMLPSPFSIAIGLSVVAMLLAFVFSRSDASSSNLSMSEIVVNWGEGMWSSALLTFAFQMMLMLILGHTLALSKPIAWLIEKISKRFCTSGPQAAFTLTLLTLLMAFVNWGLGLVFGAIFARKVGDYAVKNGIAMNYPLLAAGAYAGMMVWHGGLSGSALVKVAEPGHLEALMKGSSVLQVPESIPLSETVFSGMNIAASLALLIILPLSVYLIAKSYKGGVPQLSTKLVQAKAEETVQGAERLDLWNLVGIAFGVLVLISSLVMLAQSQDIASLKFITPNWINQSTLALTLIFHGNIRSFLSAVDDAIGGAAGILIQFPLYFGVMGVIQGAGLIPYFSELMSASGETLFPLLTMLSAGVVNIFVPSGGGQWAVQGALVIQSALETNVPLNKAILALAYGDQLTNMLQPFWALPLLGITGLKAKEILPYTLLLMGIGVIIFTSVLLIF
ncbi:MAG: TIGR00366 family protein [Flavobacteriales bacterium]|nr:TIGR00366 family protein [Flavobacteriales bacterium]